MCVVASYLLVQTVARTQGSSKFCGEYTKSLPVNILCWCVFRLQYTGLCVYVCVCMCVCVCVCVDS